MHRKIHAGGPCGHADVHRAAIGHRAHERHGGWGGPPFGGGGFRRGRKARRGDVRTAALLLLAEEPRNGYGIMQELEARSDGAWRPSAGSVYPALQLLEDEGLIRSEEADGRRLLHLTDAGRKVVEERGSDQPAPWDELAGDGSDEVRAMAKAMREAMVAAGQVLQTGSEGQRAEARKLLVALRRDLYRILADGTDGEDIDA